LIRYIIMSMLISFLFLTFHDFCLIIRNTFIQSLLIWSTGRIKIHRPYNHFSQHYRTIRFLFCSSSFDKTSTIMVNNTNNVWRLLWTLLHQWFYATLFHFYIICSMFIFREDNQTNEQGKLKIFFIFFFGESRVELPK